MKIPRVELFEWLLDNFEDAKYILAFSNMQGVTKKEYDKLIGYEIPPDFDMGWDAHYGVPELNEALAKMYKCDPENIVTASGGSEANFLVFLATLDHEDEFIVEQPGYQPMWLAPEMLGAKMVPWLRRYDAGFRLDLDALEGLITDRTKLIVITNPHNPSGVVADREDELRRLGELAHAKGIHVLIDEVFLDGAFQPQDSGFKLPGTVITGSMTKVYGLGGHRTGWVVGPKEIAHKCQLAKAHTDAASSRMGEIMNAHALLNAREHLVQRFNNRALSNFRITKDWVEGNTDIVEWVEPHGGIMCYPRYKVDIGSKELCQKLLNDHGVLVNPGEYFGTENHFRLSYPCSEEELKAGLEEITKCLRELSQ
jgi:aspartate/methionine/tyrosine aminotransferase